MHHIFNSIRISEGMQIRASQATESAVSGGKVCMVL